MTTTRDSKKVPSRSTKTRGATVAPVRARRGEPADEAPDAVDAAPPAEVTAASTDDGDARRLAIETTAYYLAEARGFEPGHELEDWIAAERLVAEREAGAPPT